MTSNSTSECKSPVIFIKEGSARTSSRNVAEYFEKRHDAVIRDVRNLIDKAPQLAHHNFVEFKNKDLTGESTSHVEMDRDGFTLLAMGFTGTKALKFKLAYITAFNAMEAELRARDDEDDVVIAVSTPEADARMLVGEARRTFGPKAAQQLWGQLGLPVVPAMLLPDDRPDLFTLEIRRAA